MQAIIMAAGKGLRMRPLTENTPKPLLKIGDSTILDHTLSQLPDSVDEVIIVVGYLKEQIVNHVSVNHPNLNVKYVEVPNAIGTGYAAAACKDVVTGKFLVLNGDDLYFKPDLEKLVAHDWSMLVLRRNDTTRFGIIESDESGNFSAIRPGGVDMPGPVNIGAYVLDLEYFSAPLVKTSSGEYGLPHTLLQMSLSGRPIKLVEATKWEPIGFPEDLAALNQDQSWKK